MASVSTTAARVGRSEACDMESVARSFVDIEPTRDCTHRAVASAAVNHGVFGHSQRTFAQEPRFVQVLRIGIHRRSPR